MTFSRFWHDPVISGVLSTGISTMIWPFFLGGDCRLGAKPSSPVRVAARLPPLPPGGGLTRQKLCLCPEAGPTLTPVHYLQPVPFRCSASQ